MTRLTMLLNLFFFGYHERVFLHEKKNVFAMSDEEGIELMREINALSKCGFLVILVGHK